MDNMSAYTMQGHEGVILRKKGGASKEKIKTGRNFALTRLNNAEFGGSSKAGKAIRDAIWMVKHLANYNFSGHLNALAKTILKKDTEADWGERAIRFSQHHGMLEGFTLNRQLLFNSVVRHPLSCTLSRDEGKASLLLPALVPGINFYTPPGQHLYRFIFTLGVIPDMICTPDGYKPQVPQYHATYLITEWHTVTELTTQQNFELALENFTGLDASNSLILAAGIEFGFPLTNDIIQSVKYAGTATIFATA
jgi:hypothetical protein